MWANEGVFWHEWFGGFGSVNCKLITNLSVSFGTKNDFLSLPIPNCKHVIGGGAKGGQFIA